MDFKTSDKPNESPFLNGSLKVFLPATMSVKELIDVLSFVTVTIKDIRENKVKKITTIPHEVRLSSLQDLAKGKTKELEKKEDKK